MFYNYSSDSLIQLGDTWVRASRIESVKSEPTTSTANEKITIIMFSGEKHVFTAKQGVAQQIIDKLTGR